jgi:hypothetical protein
LVLALDTVLFSEMMRWEDVVRGKRSENRRSSNLIHTAVLAAVLLVVTPYGEGREGVEVEEGTHVQVEGDWLEDGEEGGRQLLPLDEEISAGVLEDPLDKYGEGREGEEAGRGGGSLELQLPLKGILCGVQLEPCHDLSAWLLSSSYVGLAGDHGSHGGGHLV